MQESKVTILIPSFNGASILSTELPRLINFLERSLRSFEIILINDGGDDGGDDGEAMSSLQNPPLVRLISYEPNRGKGQAIRTGFQHAQGDIIVYTDADIPFAYENLLAIVDLLQSGEADVVMGDRTLPQSRYYLHTTPVRRIGSNIISWFANRMIDASIEDSQCGLKGFTRAAAINTIAISRTCRFAIDFEILYLASRKKLRVKKIPVQLRNQAKSTVRPFSDGLRMIWDILFTIKR